jgi:hypothetical protein
MKKLEKQRAARILATAATVGNKVDTAKRGRKKTNVLWKKKKNLVNKSSECAIYCKQHVMVLIHDPKYNRITSFQSAPDDFNIEKLVEM